MFYKYIVTLLALNGLIRVEAWQKRVKCKKILSHDNGEHTCSMSDNTEISSKNFIVAEYNDIITNLDFVRNKRIFYLPERIYEKFPTLRVIEAQSCSILEITIANFAKLDSLEKLQLQNNQIETVPDKVFADLSSLKILRLSE